MPDLEILTRKVTPAIVTGAGNSVSSAIVVGHRSKRKLLRHNLIDSFVFRHDVLVKWVRTSGRRETLGGVWYCDRCVTL